MESHLSSRLSTSHYWHWVPVGSIRCLPPTGQPHQECDSDAPDWHGFAQVAQKMLLVQGTYCLKIPRKDGTCTLLPIVKTHKYLGSILTYVNLEDATLTYRLKCGKQSFFRLIRFSGKTGQCSRAFKLRLWQQCIVSSYIYALFPCGLTGAGCYRFESAMFQDLRRLTNNWSHLTRVSHLDLAAQLKLEPPLDLLQVRWQEHAERTVREGANLHAYDLLHSLNVEDHWQTLYVQIASAVCNRPNPSQPQHEPCWKCPHCPKQFHLRAVMRRHVVSQHPDLDSTPQFSIVRDAKCRHCDKKLSSRFNLKQHIEHQWCTQFDSALQEIQPLCTQPQIKDRILDGRWQTLLADRGLCRELTSYCCLCNTWCAHTKSLAAHLKRAHGDLFTQAAQHRADIDQHVRWGDQCQVCEQPVHKTNKCPVTMQLAVLKQYLQAAPAELRAESLALPEPVPSADLRSMVPMRRALQLPALMPVETVEEAMTSVHTVVAASRITWDSRDTSSTRGAPNLTCPNHHRLGFYGINQPYTWTLPNCSPWKLDVWSRFPHAPEARMCAVWPSLWQCCTPSWHLASDHSDAWQGAQNYHSHLLDHYQPLGEACLCGVWVRHTGHQCPVAAQLGILRMLIRQNTEPPSFFLWEPFLACLADGRGLLQRVGSSWVRLFLRQLL